jgi:hypothetical protein
MKVLAEDCEEVSITKEARTEMNSATYDKCAKQLDIIKRYLNKKYQHKREVYGRLIDASIVLFP